jgi:hypothetical protein
MGQADSESLFLARGQGYAIHFKVGGILLISSEGTVRMEWDNANAAPRVSARKR